MTDFDLTGELIEGAGSLLHKAPIIHGSGPALKNSQTPQLIT